jgi:nucleoside 2-deoxyribosyltransferase
LHALVARADIVLMDLRGFRMENRGCRYELGVLAKDNHPRRIVVLYDRDTARAEASSDIDADAAGRFEWLSADEMEGAMADRVLSALFATKA